MKGDVEKGIAIYEVLVIMSRAAFALDLATLHCRWQDRAHVL